MRILHAINSGGRGGAEKHTLDLVEGLHNRGHEVYVWCPKGEVADEIKEVGVTVVNIKIGLDIDPAYIFALTKFLKEKRIDILHAHELKAVGNALLAGFFAGTKVRIAHTHTPISEWKISPLKKFINIRFFYTPFVNLFATREMALTSSRKRVKVKEGIKESRLEVIPNGIKIDDFTISSEVQKKYRKEILNRHNIPEDAYVFGIIGRLSMEKGIPSLIEGFTNFFNSPTVNKDKTYLLVVGGGAIKEEVLAKVKELNMGANIIVTGVSYLEEDKVKYLSSFDTFVFPSLAEGFGIVLLEAMAMPLPVICSDLEVLQEVGGSTVVFFETNNPENMGEKMFNLYSKKDRLDNVKEDARKRVEQLYTVKLFTDNYEKLYSELLEARS
jgi:glycosyltransferase involved in cell wall biosynthesis